MRNWILTLLVGMGGILLLPSTATAECGCQSYRCMSCNQLWYERNAIFARKGYCFQTRRAIRAFGPRCYPPYGRLSPWERDRVSEIRYWERVKGCR